MLFNSIGFIAGFFPVVLIGYFLLARGSHRLAALWVALSSVFFYGWWNYHYVPLLLVSVLFNYAAGFLIARRVRRQDARMARLYLAGAITLNLVLLGYYKYAGFFVHSLDHLSGLHVAVQTIILPLGISFFTFTQIAFLVDTASGRVAEYDFIHYLLFVTYFPHLIAGPILHHAQMIPQFQLKSTYRWDWNNVAMGLTFFVVGLAKKVVLADTFAVTSTAIFSAVAHGSIPFLFESWLGALSYALQLYFDFSGYCDMAVGLSLFFNVRLPLNFNSPYKAANIIDFWRRWHMTLSAFLRDYLYIPLGGNRLGPARRYANLMITMLLGGLWHGANWTFVAWGGLHGLYLAANHGFRELRARLNWPDGAFGRPGLLLSQAATFIAVLFAWVFFRANNFQTAWMLVKGMVGLNGVSLFNSSAHLAPALVQWLTAHHVVFLGFTPITNFTGDSLKNLAIGLAIVWLLPNSQEWIGYDPRESAPAASGPQVLVRWQPRSIVTQCAVGIIFAFCLLSLMSGAPSEFLYFQF
jgi:D-alanyl-lipoteichoic acid acyltransferase DltB (MBOAT superfamily)